MKKKKFVWTLPLVITVEVIFAIAVFLLLYIFFANATCVPAGKNLRRTDWLAFLGSYISLFGSILISTITLWQNHQLRLINDEQQDKIEKLTIHANEISVVSKIIEIENGNLQELTKAFDEFTKKCDPGNIAVSYATGVSNQVILLKSMVQIEQEIDTAFFAVSRELRKDLKLKADDETPIKIAVGNYYQSAKKTVEALRKNPTTFPKDDYEAHETNRDNFIKQREIYLSEQERKLSRLLYEDLCVAEIKNMYNRVS